MNKTFMAGIYGIQSINDPQVRHVMKQIIESYKNINHIPQDAKLTDTQRDDICGQLADYILEIGGKEYERRQ